MNRNDVTGMTGRDLPVTSSDQTSRRRILRLAGAGSAALVAALLPRNGARAGHGAGTDADALHLGETNDAIATTRLHTNISDPGDLEGNIGLFLQHQAGGAMQVLSFQGVAVSGVSASGTTDGHALFQGIGISGIGQNDGVGVEGSSAGPGDTGGAGAGVRGLSGTGPGVAGDSGSGPGVRGESQSGPGIEGSGFGEEPGVRGHSSSGPGVEGNSQSAPGVAGSSLDSVGVNGNSVNGPGVAGLSENATGVAGFSEGARGVNGGSTTGNGVEGHSESGIGVKGESNGGLALDVVGKARFSTAGSGQVVAGQDSATVANQAVTADSHINISLTSDPGSRQLLWVERNPGVGFTVHLSSGPPPQRVQTDFTYLIVEPAVS